MPQLIEIKTMIERLIPLCKGPAFGDWERKFVQGIDNRTAFARQAGMPLGLTDAQAYKVEQLYQRHCR
jgi:hypothetical protein